MSSLAALFSTNKPCDEAVDEVMRQLQEASFQVVRTFDLQVARQPYSAQICSACPSHTNDLCSCQMVVLLVYEEEKEPISLVAHGKDNHTWFDMIEPAGQRSDSRSVIRRMFAQQR